MIQSEICKRCNELIEDGGCECYVEDLEEEEDEEDEKDS